MDSVDRKRNGICGSGEGGPEITAHGVPMPAASAPAQEASVRTWNDISPSAGNAA
jgi:hypothetical protein